MFKLRYQEDYPAASYSPHLTQRKALPGPRKWRELLVLNTCSSLHGFSRVLMCQFYSSPMAVGHHCHAEILSLAPGCLISLGEWGKLLTYVQVWCAGGLWPGHRKHFESHNLRPQRNSALCSTEKPSLLQDGDYPVLKTTLESGQWCGICFCSPGLHWVTSLGVFAPNMHPRVSLWLLSCCSAQPGLLREAVQAGSKTHSWSDSTVPFLLAFLAEQALH